jgi:hypothetical protein
MLLVSVITMYGKKDKECKMGDDVVPECQGEFDSFAPGDFDNVAAWVWAA